MTRAIVGIDVSKKKLDVTVLFGVDERRKKTFPNDLGGFEKLLTWVGRYHSGDIHACTEFTGVYDEDVAEFLYDKGQTVSRVNPMRIKSFAQSKLTRTKTDPKDSMVIADYCKLYNPAPWNPEPLHTKTLKDLTRTLESLKDDVHLMANRLEKYQGRESPAKELLQAYLIEAGKRVKDVEKQVRAHVKAHPGLAEKVALLRTIPGVGETTAWTVLAEVPDIRGFQDARQLAAFAGLTPCQRQSGSSVNGRSRLSKIGSRRLRKALYMPAIVAKTHNPVVAAFFDRLIQRGKCKMSAIGAAMRKLLHIIFGVLTNKLPFGENIV